MAAKNLKLGSALVIAALISACSFAGAQNSQTTSANPSNNAGGLGSYLVIDCNVPASHLVDRSGKDVLTPVKLTVKSDKKTLSSISLKAEIPAHISLDDPARAYVGERRVEFSDARVVSGSYFNTRVGQGVKYEIAANQKIAMTQNGQKKISNIKTIRISEAKGADYLSVSMELEGDSGQQTEEGVSLSICEMKNAALLAQFPK